MRRRDEKRGKGGSRTAPTWREIMAGITLAIAAPAAAAAMYSIYLFLGGN